MGSLFFLNLPRLFLPGILEPDTYRLLAANSCEWRGSPHERSCARRRSDPFVLGPHAAFGSSFRWCTGGGGRKAMNWWRNLIGWFENELQSLPTALCHIVEERHAVVDILHHLNTIHLGGIFRGSTYFFLCWDVAGASWSITSMKRNTACLSFLGSKGTTCNSSLSAFQLLCKKLFL